MNEKNRVVVSGVDLPFMDCVNLILRLALAAIPAFLLFTVLVSIVLALFGAMLSGAK